MSRLAVAAFAALLAGPPPEPAEVDTDTLLLQLRACDAEIDDREPDGLGWWEGLMACEQRLAELGRRELPGGEATLWSLFETLRMPDLRLAALGAVMDVRLRAAAADDTPVPDTPDRSLVPPPAAGRGEPDEEPEWVATAPDELVAAYRMVTVATDDYWEALGALAGEPALGYFAHREAFEHAIEDYLRGRVPARQAVQRVGRFEWDGGCGNGAGVFLGPRDKALLLAFLELGERRLGLGALQSNMARGLLEREPGAGDLKSRLAARLGADWETLAVGELLHGSQDAVASVARLGTERGAALLLASLDLPRQEAGDVRIGDDETVVAAVAALVAPGSSCPPPMFVSSLDLTREAPELPTSVQLAALEALHARADLGAGLETGAAAAHQLRRICRPESLAAFESMAASPYSAVRRPAVDALRSLGQDVEDVPAPPVRLRLTVDGQPWTRRVEVHLDRHDMSTSFGATPDRDGVLELERDPFVDTRRPVASLTVAAPDEDARGGGTWFAAELPVPVALDTPTDVVVRTTPVTVRFAPRGAGACEGAACSVMLMYDPSPAGYGDSLAERPLRAGDTWTLRLQAGRTYRAAVVSGDGARWSSPVLEPGLAAVVLELRGDRLRSIEDEVAERLAAADAQAYDQP